MYINIVFNFGFLKKLIISFNEEKKYFGSYFIYCFIILNNCFREFKDTKRSDILRSLAVRFTWSEISPEVGC